MQKTWRVRKIAKDFHNPETAHRCQVTCAFRNLEAQPNMRLPGQMIELSRLNLVDDSSDGGRVGQIRIVQKQAFFVDAGVIVERIQTRSFECAAATHDAVDFVAFFQQQLGEVGAVLACDSGDERPLRGVSSFEWSVITSPESLPGVPVPGRGRP